MSTDLELFRGWRGGDAPSGSELYRRHFNALYRFFVNKVPDCAEDLMQNTLLACIRYGDSVQKASSFRAYLFTIARNELYHHIGVSKPRADLGVSSLADVNPSPTTFVGLIERERSLLGALRSLPVDAQLILELQYWEELSTAELAEVLDAPIGTAKTRLRRAKQLLAAALKRGTDPTESDAIERWVKSMRTKVAGLADEEPTS